MWSETITSLFLSLSTKECAWMTEPYELATAMRRVCRELQVKICYQGMALCYDDELQRLGIQTVEHFVREVFLEGDAVPFCFARTVIPVHTYQHYKEQFDGLEDRLLGKTLLYPQSNRVRRSQFEYAVVEVNHPYFLKCAVDRAEKLGARRSVFYLEEHYPLLITEIFLPGIPFYQPEIKADST